MALQVAVVSQYVQEFEQAWSPNTARSVKHSLNGIAGYLDGNPQKLWDHLVTIQGDYTRVTTWTRVVKLWDWCIEKGKVDGSRNPYSQFRKRNARLFKNTYVRRPADITFRDAKARCERIEDDASRKKALELLHTGMRYEESFTLKDGLIKGKGGKHREILSMPHLNGPSFERTYMTFLRHLRKVGLKPHQLRKVFADNLAKKGFKEFDLCETMGWESLETARSYVSATHRSKRQIKIYEAINGNDEDT